MSNHTAQARQPSRATNSFVLAWGSLIQIPLSVYSGTESTSVARKEFVKGTDVNVGRANIRKDDGHIIDVNDVVRKALSTDGKWVEFNDDEVAAATCPKGQADIIAVVPVKDVAQYLPSDVVQVRPKANKGKVDPNANRAFALLATVLRKKRAVALIKVALRGPARYGLLYPNGDLVFIYTADAIRERRDLDADFKFSAQEVALATTLIETIGIEAPVLTDDTAAAVQKAVDIKAAGLPAPEAPEQVPVGDLLAALKASLPQEKGEAA